MAKPVAGRVSRKRARRLTPQGALGQAIYGLMVAHRHADGTVWTPEDIAQRCAVTQKTVREWIGGAVPAGPTFVDLAHALGIPAEALALASREEGVKRVKLPQAVDAELFGYHERATGGTPHLMHPSPKWYGLHQHAVWLSRGWPVLAFAGLVVLAWTAGATAVILFVVVVF